MKLNKHQRDSVRQLIAYKLGFPISNIKNKSELTYHLGADALDIIEIIMEFEKEYKLRISDEDIEGCINVGDFINLIEKIKSL